jgi:hypothetical protein
MLIESSNSCEEGISVKAAARVRWRWVPLIVALVFSAAALSAQTQPPAQQQTSLQTPPQTPPPARAIQLDDFLKITSVSDPQISPDGKSIAFVVSRINLEQDRSDRELLVIDHARGVPRSLTHDRRGVGSP